MSGVFVLALVLLWAAVLLPSLLRRHDVALARSAERLSSAVRVLQRPPRRPSPGPGPGASASPVDLPERVDATPAGPSAPDLGQPPAPAEPAEPARVPVPARPALTPSARAARRRRRVLVVLLLVTALGSVAGATVGAAGWVVAGAGAAALLAFLAAARRAVRRPVGTTARRAVPARVEPSAPAAEPGLLLTPPQPLLFDQEALETSAEEVQAEPGSAPAPGAPVEHAAPAEEALPLLVPAPRRRRTAVAADGTWTPIPVPPPMYLAAPRLPYPSTPRRPAAVTRGRQGQGSRQRVSAAYGVRRAVGS